MYIKSPYTHYGSFHLPPRPLEKAHRSTLSLTHSTPHRQSDSTQQPHFAKGATLLTMAQVGGRENKAGESVGPEVKYTSGVHEYPKEREDCLHHYFFRLHRNGGKGDLPYFYDIEVDEESLTVQTCHGKPGEFMVKNHPKTCASTTELQAQVATYVRSRETIDGGPFTRHHESCRLALPENIAAAASAGGGGGAAAKPESEKRKASASNKVDLGDGDDGKGNGKRRALGDGGHAAKHIVGMPTSPALTVIGPPGVPPPPPAGGEGGLPPPPPPPSVPPPPEGGVDGPPGLAGAGGVSSQPGNTSGYVSKAKIRGPYKRKTPEELLARTLARRAKKALAAAAAKGSTQ